MTIIKMHKEQIRGLLWSKGILLDKIQDEVEVNTETSEVAVKFIDSIESINMKVTLEGDKEND